jgi:tetratricopeptide (TPR) repeat protein
LVLLERKYGSRHPRVVGLENNIAVVLWWAGRHEEARLHLERAVELAAEVFGSRHRDYGFFARNLGWVLADQGLADQALAQFELAQEVWEGSLEPSHQFMYQLHGNLRRALVQLGRLEEAQLREEKRLEVSRARFGEKNLRTAGVQEMLARLLLVRGRPGDARTMCERARAIREAPEPESETPEIYRALVCLGEAEVALGNPARAVTYLEQAVAALPAILRGSKQGAGVEELVPARARFALARAVWQGGGDRRRAIELAEQARAGYQKVVAGRARYLRSELAEVEAWLAARERPRGAASTSPPSSTR